MTPRYLIIGASGFIGSRLFSFLGPDNAVATYCTRRVAGGVFFDAASMRLADAVLKQHNGLTHAFIFHGITNIDACARDPQGTERVNVTSVLAVIDDLIKHGIVPVFASSDAVFDGTRGMWTEEDPVNPILTYGRHKAQVERYLQKKSSPWLVARLAKVTGAGPGQADILSDWMDKLESGAEIRCARDQVFSPLGVDDAIDAMLGLAEGGHSGIFHVCGSRPVTRLQLLQMLIEEIDKYRELRARIIPCSIRDFEFAESRPFDTSMSPCKLYANLGRSFDDPREVCRKAAAARYGGRSVPQGAGHANAQ
ncbi:MAG TPA: sugar nucleotide-binding protein [Burkholderiales bacterium]|nr:sugar nucleotide-binding protein [Burkholderiales bacterium]